MVATPDPENVRLDPLIGTWRTQGEMLGDDGSTTIATIEGTDALGSVLRDSPVRSRATAPA